MSEFALKTSLPKELEVERERICALAKQQGLDFFDVVFEMLTYDQMNEIAAYSGFPTRYPHWRFGMEYEQLAKSYEYGLSKIYEMVINSNPAYAYLLEGNSLTDQRLVMAHVYAHVDFFKNNFTFRSTDLGSSFGAEAFGLSPKSYEPNRKWIDKMANHGSRIRKHVARLGHAKVEEFLDHCLSLENLIDPYGSYEKEGEFDEIPVSSSRISVPKLKAKSYLDPYINPASYMEEQKQKIKDERRKEKKLPSKPVRDILGFLLLEAPLENWERDCLEVIRGEALYFLPQIQTKIMNEGWASYWHSKLMTEHILDASEIIDYADNAASVLDTSGGRLNPYKLGVELYRDIEDRWNKGKFGTEWESCSSLEEKKNWDKKLGLGKQKIFEVRALYNDITFIDEFLTPEFCLEQKMFQFGYSEKNGRFEIKSKEFHAVKEKLLFQLSNAGNPVISLIDSNYKNRGELLLRHESKTLPLKKDYVSDVLKSLVRVWKRPVNLLLNEGEKEACHFHDGKVYLASEVNDE